MKQYATARAFEQALKQQVEREVRTSGRERTRVRRQIAFDRILARLQAVTPNDWLLKGGVALEYRLRGAARATRDVDLSVRDEATIAAMMHALAKVDLDDYFSVRVLEEPKAPIIDGVRAYRWTLEVELDGKRFEHCVVDVGVADPFIGEPDLVRGEALLAFAGIEPTIVPAIPIEQHISEKLHAYTRKYSGDRESTRVKDLVDLVLLSSFRTIAGSLLRATLDGVFRARNTELPTSFPEPPLSWGQPYRALTETLDITRDVLVGHRHVAAFIDPVLDRHDAIQTKEWNHISRTWGERKCESDVGGSDFPPKVER